MKKLIFMVFFLLLSACAYTPLDQDRPITIVVANDLHYAHQTIIGNFERVRDITLKADGKQINYSGEIIDAFIDQMKQVEPDILILNGDLAFNGERENHRYLAKALKQLDALILVNPGNHDIDSKQGIKMSEEKSMRMPSVTQEEFKVIYQDFGYNQASAMDQDSLSYLINISPSLDILMLDSRCDESCEDLDGGFIRSSTLKWIEEQLKQSKASGKEVLVASHHNLLIHLPRLTKGFTLDNYQELLTLFKKYDVKLNLSGHIHAQHISEADNIFDVATQSLAVYQNQVGLINYYPHQKIQYSTMPIDVSSYAKKQGYDNQELLNFEKTSLETMTYVNYRRTALKLFDEMSLDYEQEILDIASYDGKIKAYYFSGQLQDKLNEFMDDPYFIHLTQKFPYETQRLFESFDIFGKRNHRELVIPLR